MKNSGVMNCSAAMPTAVEGFRARRLDAANLSSKFCTERVAAHDHTSASMRRISALWRLTMDMSNFIAFIKRTRVGRTSCSPYSKCAKGTALAFLVVLGSAGISSTALAQSRYSTEAGNTAEARARYDQRLRACDAALPRPEYEACIRAAGRALDRRGVAANGTKAVESSDGRAKIYVAPGTTPPPGGSAELAPKTVPSRNGRATLLVPSDSTLRSTRTIVP